MNQWREDVAIFLPREVIEAVVVSGRIELLPRAKISYHAFVDMSGGRADSAALCIGHRDGEKKKIVIDYLKEYKPPFSPFDVAGRMADELRRYNIKIVHGDRYAGEYTAEAFKRNGILYRPAEKSKSELYLNLIGIVCSKEIELLDDEASVRQLANLERKTRSGGRDSVDHPAGQHDDKANCIAGCASVSSKRLFKPRAFSRGGNPLRRSLKTTTPMGRALMALR